MTSRWLAAVVPLAIVALAAPAAGDNVVANGDFASDVAGWEFLFGDAGATKSWSPLDADGSATSGSAVVTFAGSSAGAFASLLQCVPVEENRAYQLSGEMLIPSGQARTGRAAIGTTWWALPGCLGVAISAPGHFFDTVATGSWQTGSGTRTAPANAVSALVRLVVFKNEAGGSLGAQFDNVQLIPSECQGGEEGWITSAAFPDFRFKVAVTSGGQPAFFGANVADCIPGDVCLSGAVPNRAEILLRVIGPRPNGYLWLQAIRFTPSRLDLEVEQTSRGTCKAYRLEAIPPDEDTLDGVVDRTAFLP